MPGTPTSSFNRTFLVLKYQIPVAAALARLGFNRTFLVLKYALTDLAVDLAEVSFNRTFLVLKYQRQLPQALVVLCFNRTFLVLKFEEAARVIGEGARF